MNIINANKQDELLLGRQGENEATQINFSLHNWITEFGDGTAHLIAQRACDAAPYPVSTERTGETFTWTPSSADAAQSGYGMCELRWYVDDVIVKSKIWRTIVITTIADGGATPEPYQSWVNTVLAAGDKAVNAVAHPPYIGATGNWYVWDFDENSYTDSGVSSKPSFVVVGSLPAAGESGKIYLVKISGSGTAVNQYNEYIWVNSGWEKIGTTDIDLSGYAKKTDVRIFYGSTQGNTEERTVTLDSATVSRWTSLQNGDVLICWFLYPPLIDGLGISVPNFGMKPIYLNYNTKTASKTIVHANQWRYGAAVPLTYNSAAGAWLYAAPGWATDKYYGTVKLSSATNSADQTVAASSYAVKLAMDAATAAKAMSNVLIAFKIVGVNTGTSDVYLIPKGCSWGNYSKSHLNPTIETDSGAKKLFRAKSSGSLVGIMYEPDYNPDVLATIYSDAAGTKPVYNYQALGNGNTYYYFDDYD